MSGNVLASSFKLGERSRAPFATLDDGTLITYGDLQALTGRLANALASLGLAKGDRVAAQTEKSIAGLALYIACARAGFVYLPLNTAYTAAEIGYFLGNAEPRVFVCDPAKFAALSPVARQAGAGHTLTLGDDGTGTLHDVAASAAPDFDDVAAGEGDLAALLYTSGTTGQPKGAMITCGNLLSNASTLVGTWGFRADDVLLHALPIYHTHGLFTATNTVLAAGASMIFQRRFEAARVIEMLPRATVMMGVPTFYARLVADRRLTREQVASMRLFISGSAPLSAELHREFRTLTGYAILERYGMTETQMIASNPLDGERRAGTVGMPLRDVQVRISGEESGTPLGRGEVGMIQVKGPNVFAGYWKSPEKTKADFTADGFFITGDLGLISEDGYVSIVGRAKDLVISGGLNVYPAEVENEIDAIPSVAESAVIGVPHPDFGEAVVAVVAARPGARIEDAELRALLASRLAAFKLPKKICVLEQLPRNAMGKIQKNVLREQFKGLFAAEPG